MVNLYIKIIEILLKNPNVYRHFNETYVDPLIVDYLHVISKKEEEIQFLKTELINANKIIKEHEEAIKDIKNINLEKTAESGKIVKKRKYTKKNGKKGHATEQAQSNKN